MHCSAMSLNLNRNARFAVLRTMCDEGERRSSSTTIGAYYEVFHVLERTSCSVLLFKCVLRNPLCDVRIEGAKELERALKQQDGYAKWFRVHRRGDGSLHLTSEREDVVVEHSIHLPSYDLPVPACMDVSPLSQRRPRFGIDWSANGFEDDTTPRQEHCHMKGKLPLIYAKEEKVLEMSYPSPVSTAAARQLFGRIEERIMYEKEDVGAFEEDSLDEEVDLDASGENTQYGETDVFALELSSE